MSKELQAKDKMEVAAKTEQTRNRPVFVPAVDIFESEEALTLTADMPGVEKDGLFIDLKDNTLSLRGQTRETPDDGRTLLYQEYREGDYYRQFSLSDAIDQDNITASLKDGVLTLLLPKARKAKPRQIEVSAE